MSESLEGIRELEVSVVTNLKTELKITVVSTYWSIKLKGEAA